jgi:hypothetical protein
MMNEDGLRHSDYLLQCLIPLDCTFRIKRARKSSATPLVRLQVFACVLATSCRASTLWSMSSQACPMML